MSALERSLATADALAFTTQTLFSVCATGVVELTAEQVAFGVEAGLDLPDATRISPPEGYVTETQDTQNCATALPGFDGAQFDVAVYSKQVTNADGTVTTASEQAAIQLDTIRTKGVVNPVFQREVLKGIEASGGQVAAVTFTSFGFIVNFPTNGTDSGGSSNSNYIDGYYLPYWLWVLVGLSALLCCVVPLLVYLWTKRQDKKDASYMQKAYAGKEVPPGAASPQLQSPFPVSQEYLSRRSPYSLPSIRIPGTKKGSSVGSDPVKEPAVATRDVTNVPSPLGEASESAYSEDDQSQGSQSQFAHVRPSPLHPMSSWGGPLTKPSTVPLEQFVTLPSGSLRRFAGLESVMQTRSSYLSSAHQLSSMGSSSSFWSNRTPGDESAARSAMSAASVVSSATGDTPHSPLSPYVPNFRSPMSAMSALSGQSSGSSFDQTPASATRGLEHERSDAISSLSSSPQPNEADTAAAHSRRVRARAALAMLSAADAHRAHARATALAELTLHGGDGSEDDSRSQSEASGVDGALQGAAAARGARGSPHSSNLGGRSVRSLSRMLLRQAMAESDTDGSAGATGNASSGIALAGGASSDGSAARAMSRATLTSPSSGGGRSSRGTSLAEALAQLDGMHAGQQRSAAGGSIPQSPTIDVAAANAAAGAAGAGALTASALAAADAAQQEKDRRGDGKAQSPSGVSTRSSLSRKQHRWRSETSSAVSSSSESGDDAV